MKKQYIAPMLTVVSFKVENGYAASGFATLNLFHEEILDDPYSGYNSSNQENWCESEQNFFGNTGWD